MINFLFFGRSSTALFLFSSAINATCLSLPQSTNITLKNLHIQLCKSTTINNQIKPHNPLNGLFDWYQRFISSQDGAVCQFKTTCSLYMKKALQKKGFFKGLIMGFERLLRDHPFIGLNKPSNYNYD